MDRYGDRGRRPILLPQPRRLEWTGGRHPVGGRGTPVAKEIVDPVAVPRAEGYRLVVEPDRTLIVAHDAAAAAHGRATLGQLVRQADGQGTIPCVRIDDWPDFPNRGVLLDISRDKVPTLETLEGIVDLLATMKVNQIQLYTEHTFAYADHREVWERASPLTGNEVERLDAYCRERFVELVPNQNSFGHMERWLVHPRYADLAEVPYTPEDRARGDDPGFRTLCPVDPRSIEFVAGLYAELLPHFTSSQFNVGCDETTEIGRGRSREACETRGVGRVYLDFLLAIHREVGRRGRTMQFWGDIILNHPELIRELPADVVALDWGYEADHPFAVEGETFAASGVRHYVCPGTSSWLSIAGRTDNAVANIRAAAEAGIERGAIGFLTTDWGDCGHWQPLPVSFLGWSYGAAVGWCLDANRDLDLHRALDVHVFDDPSGTMGRFVADLGNVHRETGVLPKNASALALLLLFPERSLVEGRLAGLTRDGLGRAGALAREVTSRLSATAMRRPDARLVTDELRWAGAILEHGARLGMARLEAREHAIAAIPSERRRGLADELDALVLEHRRLWLARNRPGGLDDSAGRMEALLGRYRSG